MNNQILVLYKLNTLYHIFKELNLNLNFKIIQAENEKELISKISSLENYLILTEVKQNNFSNSSLIKI